MLEEDGTDGQDALGSFILGSDGDGTRSVYLDSETRKIVMNGKEVYLFAAIIGICIFIHVATKSSKIATASL